MSEIHNTKQRMPLLLASGSESDWLNNGYIEIENKMQAAVVSNDRQLDLF